MWLTAIKNHGYLGKRIAAGQDYEVHSPTDAKILQVAKLARPMQKKPTIKETTSATKNIPVRDMHATATKNIPVRDMHVESHYETRDDVPEESIEKEMTSPKEDKPRKQRRQYKHKDMLPE